MFLTLHDLTIQLQSDNAVINRQWRQLFMGWPLTDSSAAAPDMVLQLSLADALPALPDSPPYFEDNLGVLAVYQGAGEMARLHYLDGALVDVPLLEPEPGRFLYAPTARGWLTQRALDYGRFEDITFTSLAPLLRRRGYFLVHAFAAAKNGRALLIVGPSGSGKTTTGLSLLLAGWKLLSNDVLLLKEQPDGVYALASPGAIGIRPQTLDLLPKLRDMVGDLVIQGQTDVTQALLEIVDWSAAAKVTAVAFPHIEQRSQSVLSPQNRAVCLAQLMAESVDQWDAALLTAHMTILQKLSQQAAPHILLLGRDVERLPTLLKTAI